ncbi:MAG: glycosyltransferase family 4 protein [Anaerolineae bacterium]|nr:glycosyltransferase family 4 protein [Anaerolineae bacterium]
MQTSLTIGIDARFPEVTFGRGRGRYTLQQLHGVVQSAPHHQFVLFCLKKIPPSLQRFMQYPNVKLANVFHRYDLHLFYRGEAYRAALTQILDRVAREYQLDVLHLPILHNFIQPIPTKITACSVVATVYDLTPYLFKSHFQHTPTHAYYYEVALDFLRDADYLIVISQATQHDVHQLIGYPQERVQVAYPVVDVQFKRLDDAVRQAHLHGLWARLGIPAPNHYIFTVTDYFYTKNLDTLLTAYAQLPATIRQTTPLVVTFDIHQYDKIRFMRLAQQLGIVGQVIFTGKVSEDELVALYNGALFTVYPSRYEGFGYPIVEAMACGSPVITTTTSSMPEVAGDNAILVNPESADEMMRAMHDLYHDDQKRLAMRQAGYAQAQRFHLDQLTRATLQAYEAIAPLGHRHPSTEPAPTLLYARARLVASCYSYGVKRKLYDEVYYPLQKWVSSRP